MEFMIHSMLVIQKAFCLTEVFANGGWWDFCWGANIPLLGVAQYQFGNHSAKVLIS